MKKVILSIFLILVSILVVGCNGKEILIDVNCNGDVKTISLNSKRSFTCKLMNKNYRFTISRKSDEEVIIKTSEYGLATVKEDGTISLRDKEKEFTVRKDKMLTVRTQTTDYSEEMKVIIE